ncbi:hypothetical protein Tco_1263066 [Tanacetum coccineum]
MTCCIPWPLRLSALPSHMSFTLTVVAFNNLCLSACIVSPITSSITLIPIVEIVINSSRILAWFLGLEEVLSLLLVEGNLKEATVVRKAIALLRQAIRSSPGENTGTTKLESTRGDPVIGYVET